MRSTAMWASSNWDIHLPCAGLTSWTSSGRLALMKYSIWPARGTGSSNAGQQLDQTSSVMKKASPPRGAGPCPARGTQGASPGAAAARRGPATAGLPPCAS
eukprot:5233813-Pyramimonas_sp.AAC.1